MIRTSLLALALVAAAGRRRGRALEAERLRQDGLAARVPRVGVDLVAHRDEDAAAALDVAHERVGES